MSTANCLEELNLSSGPSIGEGSFEPILVPGASGPTGGVEIEDEIVSEHVGQRLIKRAVNDSVFDVAAYILSQTGQIAVSKLQLLLYYCQAWSLVWDDVPAFADAILAGPSGPFVERIRANCLGIFKVDALTLGSAERVMPNIRETCEVVVAHYNKYTSQELIFQSQSETPWKVARGRSVLGTNPPIAPSDMVSFYRALLNKNE